ncbi:MAG: glycosyltransferase family 4 protein [Patescibacteria group bacterium]|nr:glycosyltransferase family 4 protein [Patescibacteria group bacterium]MDE2588846.1 glycosyltransferase family 4 protein [Patescibacteria group bacterium]
MRILIVSSFLPFPLHSGGHVRLYNLIKELSASHKIDLVCEKRDFQSEKDINEVQKFCEEVITVDRKKQWSVENILKTSVSTYPFLLVGHTSPQMKQKIVSLLNTKKYDVIHVETFYVYQNLPRTYIPVVLVEHNIEYLVYKRYMDVSPVYMRPLLSLDIKKIKKWEEYFWKKATALVAVSQKEKEQMTRPDVYIVPNGVDIQTFSPKKKTYNRKAKYVLFIGDFKWIQNIQAVQFILQDIWPRVQMENTKLWIVGKNMPESFKAMGDKRVIFDSDATDETWKIYQKADVLLAPIMVGGGTSYKILESMASGTPVVTTRLGVEGIGAKHDKHALVGKTADELAGFVEKFLTDSAFAKNIAMNARALVEETYSWKKIAKSLEDVYKNVTTTL